MLVINIGNFSSISPSKRLGERELIPHLTPPPPSHSLPSLSLSLSLSLSHTHTLSGKCKSKLDGDYSHKCSTTTPAYFFIVHIPTPSPYLQLAHNMDKQAIWQLLSVSRGNCMLNLLEGKICLFHRRVNKTNESYDVQLLKKFIRKKKKKTICQSTRACLNRLSLLTTVKGKLHSKIISSDMIEFFP